MPIDFNKVQQNVASKAEQIPTSNLKPPTTPAKPAAAPVKVSKATDNKRYTKVGFDPDVWQAMKLKKMLNDESFTDQVNDALRLYLGIKK